MDRIAAIVRTVHTVAGRCGFRPGSCAAGDGTPRSFIARAMLAVLTRRAAAQQCAVATRQERVSRALMPVRALGRPAGRRLWTRLR